jgi:hypothetical protein
MPIVKALVNAWDGVIMVANMGLWYNNRLKYREEILPVLYWLNETAVTPNKLNSFGWRETTAQHFNQTKNGYFRIGPVYKNHRNCLPHGVSRVSKDSPDYRIDWRNDDVLVLFRVHNFSGLTVIPCKAAASPLYSLHVTRPKTALGVMTVPYEGGEADCNHYCWTPTLWQPTWHGIAKLVCMRWDSEEARSVMLSPSSLSYPSRQEFSEGQVVRRSGWCSQIS